MSDLITPELLMPDQYFDAPSAPKTGEAGLMLAVLKDGIQHFRKYATAYEPDKKALFREARDWIEDTDTDYAFSFDNICDVLGLSAVYLRRELFKWLAQERAKVKPGVKRARIVPLKIA